MMKEKLRMWQDITDPREIDMLIIKVNIIFFCLIFLIGTND